IRFRARYSVPGLRVVPSSAAATARPCASAAPSPVRPIPSAHAAPISSAPPPAATTDAGSIRDLLPTRAVDRRSHEISRRAARLCAATSRRTTPPRGATGLARRSAQHLGVLSGCPHKRSLHRESQRPLSLRRRRRKMRLLTSWAARLSSQAALEVTSFLDDPIEVRDVL